MNRHIKIEFNLWAVSFFILLETLTVPLVAASNHLVVRHFVYIAIMGFLVALVIVGSLLYGLKKFIIYNSPNLFGVQLSNISGILYIGILGGVLEMVMFVVQHFMFSFHYKDYSTGFVSAFISVGFTLLLYELITYKTGYSVILENDAEEYVVRFGYVAIIKLSLLFGLYELIVCPITGWWIPYSGASRLRMAIISGILGGAFGGYCLYLCTRYLKVLVPYFTIDKKIKTN